MNIAFCLWPVVTLSLVYGLINIITSKNQTTTHTTSKRSFGIFSIIFTLIATELGGSVMLGTSQEAYTTGLFGLLYILGISIGLILLSVGFAAKMKAMNVACTIDIFSVKYHSPSIRFCASILSTITLCGLLIGQVLAAKTLLQSLGIGNELVFICFWSFALIYTILGGFQTAGITYRAQLVYIIAIFSGIFFYCIFKEPPSFFTSTILDKKLIFDTSTMDFATIFGSLVMPALYYITDQDFAQPFFEMKGRSMRMISALGASVFMIIFSLVPIYFGLKAKTLNLTIPSDASPLIPVLSILTNEVIVILAVCGIIAALIATIDSYLWCISYSITYDFNALFKNSNPTQLSNVLTFIIGITVLAASYGVNSSVVQIIISSYELYDSCLMVPLLMSYFKTDLKKGSAIGSILFGLFGFIFFRVVTVSFSGQIASLALSFIGYFLGGYIEHFLRKISAFKSSSPCSV